MRGVDRVDDAMKASADIFCGRSPPENKPADITWMNDIKSEVVISMGTMAANHLRTNLGPRIKGYLRWIYIPITNKNGTSPPGGVPFPWSRHLAIQP